jgi:hypothetical protein
MIERLWSTEEGRRRLGEIAADGPALAEAAAKGTLLSVGRQAAAVVVGTLLVKWRTTRKGRRLRTCFRPSGELREARALLRAAALGLGSPAPFVVAELRKGPMLLGALSVRPYLAGWHDGAAHVRDGGDPGVLIDALRRWHDLGFRHGDGWPKNVLVSGDGTSCVPIGCPRARFVARGERGDGRRAHDLARLLHGISEARQGSDLRSLCARYAGESAELAALWPRVEARIARQRRKEERPKRPSLPARTPPFPRLALWKGASRPLRMS